MNYVSKRLFDSAATALGSSIVVFVLLRVIPGDPVSIALGANVTMSPTELKQIRAGYGLNQSIPTQYLHWLGGIIRGNFGNSIRGGQSIRRLLIDSVPITLELILLAILIAVIIGIPLGMVSAYYHNRLPDLAARLFALFGISIPGFVLAILALLVAAIYFHWNPGVQYYTLWENPGKHFQIMILPALSLSAVSVAFITRMTRSSAVEVLQQDFIEVARAKGMSGWGVMTRHALKNGLVPVLTITGTLITSMFGAAVIVEQIFSLPGLGRMILNGILQRDYPVVQAGLIVIAVIIIGLNLVIDLLYPVLDPRIRND